MIHDRLFPTNIFIKENFYQNYKDIENAVRKDYDLNTPYWQSKPDLYKRREYEHFTKCVLSFTADILDKMRYVYDGFRVTDMWSNVLKPGETHRPHTHSNNILSGVYYVEAEQTSGIIFTDPRPQAGVIQPDVTKQFVDNASVIKYDSATNRMILFPSWLQHYVPINETKSNRISIAFNIMLKGKVGSSEEYQSAEF